jgi:hypothetical protein
MVIKIEIPDSVASRLEQALARMTLPPETQPDGTIVVRRMFPDVAAMCAHILEMNFKQYIGDIPVDEEDAQIQRQIETLAKQRSAKIRPVVEIEPRGGKP